MKIYIEGGSGNVPGLKQLSNELYGKAYASRGLRKFYYGFTPYTSGYEDHFCQITFEVEGTSAQLEFLRIVESRFSIIRVDAEDASKEGEAITQWGKDHEQRSLPKEVKVPKKVAGALAEVEDARAVKLLVAALTGDYPDYQEAFKAMGELGEVALAPLIAALEQNGDWPVRVRAAIALGKLGDARAVKPLSVAVKDDEEWPVRKDAANALGELGDARAVEPLLVALKEKKDDYSYEVQMAAAAALAKLGDPKAAGPLADVLKRDHEWPVRQAAAQALGEIGDARAAEPLRAALKDAEERVQASAAEALEAVTSRAGSKVRAGDATRAPGETKTASATKAAPSGKGAAEPAVRITAPEQAPPPARPSPAPQPARTETRLLLLGMNLLLTVLTLACCAVTAYCFLLADDASGAAQICGALSVLGTVALLIFTLAGWSSMGRQG